MTFSRYCVTFSGVSDDKPDPVWRITPLARSLLDFQIMLDSPQHGPFFRNVETIKSLHEEKKRLESQINVLYILTFIGSLIVMSGPLPKDAKFSVFGFEAPLAIFPQQVVAMLTAGLFGYYCTLFFSLIIVQQMAQRILISEGRESWQFFAARFDASSVWSVLVSPKHVGYRSPRREIVFALVIVLVALAIVFAHALIMIMAMILAFLAALQTGSILLIFLGSASLVIAIVSTLAVLVGVLMPMPYRLDAEALAKLDAQPEPE